MGVNTVAVSGNLTRDPELKHLPSGTSICEFAIAHNRRWRDGDDWKEQVHFFDCAAWGNFGELLARKLRKADSVTVSGRMEYSSWEQEDGTKRSRIKVIVNDIESRAMFRKADEENRPADEGSQEHVPASGGGPIDDIPF